ncbi:MAG: tRNA 5-methoxyuridine(34)/uridine 5-oxyacetic acid(34) synthase CmoB [Xanthomonadales bacterium]|nr:tRNA 5-methoxyuridine(34)/uridine 5-oxyacetic acid(34) synthase CmoB [Xanthomonadales bacterium]
MSGVYDELLRRWPDSGWLAQTIRLAEHRLQDHPHGDLPRWREALDCLPRVQTRAVLDRPTPSLGADAADPGALRSLLMELHPWRKGPLCLGGAAIDTEWRSDWKWARIAPHIDLAGARVLDIGCGNGYYGLRMLGAGAGLVVGIDPTVLFVMQWLACRHFGGDLANFVLPLGVEELPPGPAGFDTVLSMGVLYHRRDPRQHLSQLKTLLRPGGTLVLESLVLPPGQEEDLLLPAGRYARMPNVWAVPGTARLTGWLLEAGLRHISLVDVTPTTTAEQRSTRWMRFESLEQALDPEDRARTVEGHPAPVRAVLLAQA